MCDQYSKQLETYFLKTWHSSTSQWTSQAQPTAFLTFMSECFFWQSLHLCQLKAKHKKTQHILPMFCVLPTSKHWCEQSGCSGWQIACRCKGNNSGHFLYWTKYHQHKLPGRVFVVCNLLLLFKNNVESHTLSILARPKTAPSSQIQTI